MLAFHIRIVTLAVVWDSVVPSGRYKDHGPGIL